MRVRRLIISLVCFFISYCDICRGTNIVAVGSSGTIRQTSDDGANWFIRSFGSNVGSNDLQCIGGTCWVAGSGGAIYKSIDAGVTWAPLNSGTTTSLTDVQFLNKRLGWAVGYADKVFATTNGGTTWTSTTVSGASSFNGVHFIDSQTGWLVGLNGTIRRTIDGGQNWSFQTSGTSEKIWAIQFLDANNGFYVGDAKVGRSTNGGSTWTDVTPPTIAGRGVNDLQFFDSLHGFIVGSNGLAYKTDNGGVDWAELNIGLSTQTAIEDISMLSPSVGAIAATYADGFGALAYVRTTIDGGQTWTPQTIGPTSSLRGVAMFNVPAIGDFNGDNQVNSLDYDKWRSTFASISNPDADGNDNGVVDAGDYVIWRNALQSMGTSAAVPEPQVSALYILLGAFGTFHRRRNSHGERC